VGIKKTLLQTSNMLMSAFRIRNKLKKLGFLEKYVDDISLDTLPRANIAKPLSSAGMRFNLS